MRRALLLTLFLAGCSSSQLCSNCPDISGTYALSFDSPPSSDACNALGVSVQNGPLTVTQVGSSVHGSFASVSLDGNLTTDDQVTLSGTGFDGADGGTSIDTLSLFGEFQSLGGADGGSAQIVGTFSGNYQRTVSGQQQSCSVSAGFTARR